MAEKEPSGETAKTFSEVLRRLHLLITAGEVDVSACTMTPGYQQKWRQYHPCHMLNYCTSTAWAASLRLYMANAVCNHYLNTLLFTTCISLQKEGFGHM